VAEYCGPKTEQLSASTVLEIYKYAQSFVDNDYLDRAWEEMQPEDREKGYPVVMRFHHEWASRKAWSLFDEVRRK